ncbi:MAG: Gfo/Idh/MocA family protein, partial [Flavisolibacter sp.]
MKVLIIGLGSIAKKHIAALKEIDPAVELFAIRSSTGSNQMDGVIDLYQLDEARKLEVDFIIISNPTFKHKETIAKLIDFNRPLFIEKPLFDKLENDALLELIAQKKITTYVACNLRFLDCLKFSRKFIAGKRINEVNIYCGSYLPEWRPGQNFREVYSANKEMGGGVHIDLIHELDYAYWFFGKPKRVKRSTSSVSSLKIDAVDYANFLLGYDQFSINVILNYYRRDAKRTLEIICEDGSLNVDLLKNEVAWNSKVIFTTKQVISDTYKEQMSFFIE